MKNAENKLILFFVINPSSGNNQINWALEITKYFAQTHHTIELYTLSKEYKLGTLKSKIKSLLPDQVIAVGGDGTIKLVAECLIHTNIKMGMLPAGSANGLAKELGISEVPSEALDVVVKGHSKKIHVTEINKEICIHLSDIGLNAYAIKMFETQGIRGMWGYLMATIKVLLQNPILEVEMRIDGKLIKTKAAMIIVANATKYGTGLEVNPIGKLDDDLFEVIVIKKISPLEIFKRAFTNEDYDSEKTEVFQTNALTMTSRKKVHFQIDGEYLGKVTKIKANILINALVIVVPES
jgi:diacylglycerol kinase (ATP)